MGGKKIQHHTSAKLAAKAKEYVRNDTHNIHAWMGFEKNRAGRAGGHVEAAEEGPRRASEREWRWTGVRG